MITINVMLSQHGEYWAARVREIDVFAEARGKLNALAKLHETLLIRAVLSRRGPDPSRRFKENAEIDEKYKSKFETMWADARRINLALPDGFEGVFSYGEVREYHVDD